MRLHANAKTTPALRLDLIERIQIGEPVQEAARAIGISRSTAYKWLRRFREEGPSGLLDRSSAPRRIPHQTSQAREQRIGELRGLRLLMREIAQRLRMAISTVGAVLKRLGLGRLPPLNPPPPVRRYERERPGELIHVDTKKLGRFSEIGHRIHGDRSVRSRGDGWEYVHVCVDDNSRVSYVEILESEDAFDCCAFLERAVAAFASIGVIVEEVLSDNAGPYRGRLWRQTCDDLQITPRRTNPYTPRTNGKAERFIQTLLREWAYKKPYASSSARRRGLLPWLRRYNEQRGHHSLGGLTPFQRLEAAGYNLPGNNS